MSKLPIVLLAVAALLLGSLPATSGSAWAGGFFSHGRHHGYHGQHHHFKSHKHFKRHHYAGRHHHGRHHHRHHGGGYGDEILLGAGIIGGAVIVGSVLSQPRAAPPPTVYYPAPPPTVYYAPPPQPYCVQDQVYRTLPDGRLQWGTRTRCY